MKMATINEIMSFFDDFCPPSLSESWDNDGLMLCRNRDSEIKKAVCSLDCTFGAINFAIKEKAGLIVTHHPLIFGKISRLDNDPLSEKIYLLLENNISVISLHTRLDSAPSGINAAIAEELGLNEVFSFDEQGFIKAEGCGRLGFLKEPMKSEDFARFVAEKMPYENIRFTRGSDVTKKAAVVSGAGKDFIDAALRLGADTFVTGEANYHTLLDAVDLKMNVIEAGHFGSEQVSADILKRALQGKLGIEALIYRDECPMAII